MASMISDPNGRKRLQFVAGDGTRRTIRLGKASVRQAESIKVKVEQLALAATGATGVVDDETVKWLGGLDDGLYGKLAAVGLVGRRESTRLGDFIDQYIASRTDAKPGTVLVLRQAQASLTDFFGQDKPLREITEDDAENWRLHQVGLGYAEATIRKRAGNAKQFFRVALRRKLICSNPFIDLQSAAKANKAREYFVSRQDVQKVLDACPDSQWRLIFALCRFGGLRCPSEVLGLRWQDVNWEQHRFLVHSPKTEHHEGGESRLVPLFPELAPYLQTAFDEAESGTEHVITRYRQANCNLRTQLNRIIHKAGLKPWPRLFQNLRSTRETELAETFPLHVVTTWIGNTQLVARKHYLQVTDEHFAKAAQNAAHSEPQAQKEAQQVIVEFRTDSQATLDNDSENGDSLVGANCCKSLQDKGMGDIGFEPMTSRV